MVLELVSATADAASRQNSPTKTDASKAKQGWRNTGFALKVECNLCPGGWCDGTMSPTSGCAI